MSNNSFDPSDFPPWLPTLWNLTTLYVFSFVFQHCMSLTTSEFNIFSHGRKMENTQLKGQIPTSFFSLGYLQNV